jgi:L-threonylcarbamoyladenylate synthase
MNASRKQPPEGTAGQVERWSFGDDPQRVAGALARGAVLAVPTESSYALAVDPRDAEGVRRIFRLKGRPEGKALPVVGAGIASFRRLGAALDDPALAWAAARWPAALSVLVTLRRPIPASAGGRTLAVRVPDHEPLRTLLAALGRTLTATSANPSGEEPYLEAGSLVSWLTDAGAATGVQVLVVDGGTLPGGAPSTLVELVAGEPVVLRSGRYEIG